MTKHLKMENEEKETLAPKPEEEKTSENQTEEGTSKETPEKTGEQSKELQSALAQKEHFRDKAEKLEKQVQEQSQDKAKEIAPAGTSPMEVVKLAKALEGYNQNEVEYITRNAKDSSIGAIIEATNDEWVKTAIAGTREKVEKEKSIPEPSSPSSAEGVKTSQDIENMSKEDHKKYEEQMLKRQKGIGI